MSKVLHTPTAADKPFPPLRAPFPYFGGKSRVAHLVWSRLGDVATYNEPFAGSLAVLLGRPHAPRVETVNDKDAMLSNFWRALRNDPEEVAYWADAPVNEVDLHANHRWLVEQLREGFSERMMTDPEFNDPKIAGRWCWGICLWIGSGWCQQPGTKRANGSPANLEFVSRFAAHGQGMIQRRWQGGGQGGGSGVHAPRLSQQKPELRGDAGATGSGIHASGFEAKHAPLWQQRPKLHGDGDETGLARHQSAGLYAYMHQLAARLRRVRVCCGDWKRVLTPSVTTYIGTCGVFLDPPYAHDLRERCYSEDHDISADVREWAIANGDNPDFRIALCGYENEHVMPDSWECVPWKAHGGYSRSERGIANRSRERIWFSPHCLQPGLFGHAEPPARVAGAED